MARSGSDKLKQLDWCTRVRVYTRTSGICYLSFWRPLFPR